MAYDDIPEDDTPEAEADPEVPVDLTELHEIGEWRAAAAMQPQIGG